MPATRQDVIAAYHQFPQIFDAAMAIPKDLVEQPGPQRFTRVQGHDGTPAVFMTKKVMLPRTRTTWKPSFARAAISSEPVILGLRLMLRW